MSRQEDLARIEEALAAAAREFERFKPGAVEVEHKTPGDPVTEADRAVNEVLHRILPRSGEGWLSEETADDRSRLAASRVWVVDPLDGTREFVQAIPEWCVSIGLVEDARPVAGGILNPATGERVVGAVGTGVTLNGNPAVTRATTDLVGARVLASRSEVKRGEWERFRDSPFEVVPCGSVAYKLACVAAGLTDATWTLVPKHEWDVAAGVALVLAAGGAAYDLRGKVPLFNRPRPKLDGLIATCAGLRGPVDRLLAIGARDGDGTPGEVDR